MENAVEVGEYKGFQFGNNNIIDILHFVDDTIILGEGVNQNMWTLKAMLRGFELMSGLKVNFFKSNIYDINLDDTNM